MGGGQRAATKKRMREIRDSRKVEDVQQEDTSFIPSRGRGLAANATQAVAGMQPTGRALPSIILGVHTAPDGHVRAALCAHPMGSLVNIEIDLESRGICRAIAADMAGTRRRRANAVATFRTISHRLSTYRRAWSSRLGVNSPARNFNIPLLRLLVSHFGYVGRRIVQDLADGMPIGWEVLTAGSLVAREHPAALSLPERRKGIPERNAEAIERVEKFRPTPVGIACWEKSLKEVEAGWLSTPVPITTELAETKQLSSRFAIVKRRAGGTDKVRFVGDLRASAVNETLTMHDTAVPDSLDVFFAISSYFRLLQPGCPIKAGSVDFPDAYKSVGICEGQEEFSSVLSGPPSGPLLVSRLRAQPFGSARAPANWGRVTALLKWILAKFFGIGLSVFVEDCFIIVPAETCEGAFARINEIIELRGFKLGGKKAHFPSEKILLLWAQVEIDHLGITATVPVERLDALIEELGKCLRPGPCRRGRQPSCGESLVSPSR